MEWLLFLFLAGCAVKCDDSNYYVIEMPAEDTPTTYQKQNKLQVYWNVPTMQCRSKKLPFKNLERFGIIQNQDDGFRGEKISILYDPGFFPALLRNETSGNLRFRNGGVPQEGDLQLHLKSFRSVLNQSIPDEDFSGVGIIDFESWRPILRQNFGDVLPYKSVSYEIEKRRHWWWPQNWVQDEAKRRFEEAARLFMQNTISIAKQMRPRAVWGYYGFPYCFNMAAHNMKERCGSNVNAENDQIDWLWMESSALYPSVYSSKDLTSTQLTQLIRGRVKEAARVRRRDKPILPYFWFRYRDGGFLSETDLHTALQTFNQSEATGFIVWGSSNDVNTVDKCQKLHNYIETVFGPAVAKYTKNTYKQKDKPFSANEIDNDNRKSGVTAITTAVTAEANDATTLMDDVFDNIYDTTTLDSTLDYTVDSIKNTVTLDESNSSIEESSFSTDDETMPVNSKNKSELQLESINLNTFIDHLFKLFDNTSEKNLAESVIRTTGVVNEENTAFTESSFSVLSTNTSGYSSIANNLDTSDKENSTDLDYSYPVELSRPEYSSTQNVKTITTDYVTTEFGNLESITESGPDLLINYLTKKATEVIPNQVTESTNYEMSENRETSTLYSTEVNKPGHNETKTDDTENLFNLSTSTTEINLANRLDQTTIDIFETSTYRESTYLFSKDKKKKRPELTNESTNTESIVRDVTEHTAKDVTKNPFKDIITDKNSHLIDPNESTVKHYSQTDIFEIILPSTTESNFPIEVTDASTYSDIRFKGDLNNYTSKYEPISSPELITVETETYTTNNAIVSTTTDSNNIFFNRDTFFTSHFNIYGVETGTEEEYTTKNDIVEPSSEGWKEDLPKKVYLVKQNKTLSRSTTDEYINYKNDLMGRTDSYSENTQAITKDAVQYNNKNEDESTSTNLDTTFSSPESLTSGTTLNQVVVRVV